MKIKLIGAMMLVSAAAWSASLDLAPPGLTPFTAVSGLAGDRGIFFTANANMSIGVAGIWMNPVSATQLRASLYNADATLLTRGTQIAQFDAAVSGVGMGLRNIAVNFNLTAGQTYYLGFDVIAPPGSWGGSDTLEFYSSHLSSFTVGGLTVLDGGADGNFGNRVMPHIVLDTEAQRTQGDPQQTGVPEPSSWMLLGSAILIPALRRLKR